MVCALHMVPIEWSITYRPSRSISGRWTCHPWVSHSLKRETATLQRISKATYQFPHGSPASIHVNPGSCWQPQEIPSVFMWHPTAFTAANRPTRDNVESQGIYEMQCGCHIRGNEKQTSKQFRLLDKQCHVYCLGCFVTPFFKHI